MARWKSDSLLLGREYLCRQSLLAVGGVDSLDWLQNLEGTPMHIPLEFNQVFPYIFAPDAANYLAFLSDGLGGEIVSVLAAPDGKVRNAHIRFGDATLMVSEANEQLGAMRATYYIYVENADEAMARAVKAGGIQRGQIGDMPYGDRQGGLIDPAATSGGYRSGYPPDPTMPNLEVDANCSPQSVSARDTGQPSSTSRTFFARATIENGFARNDTP
jgi:PhnB protein